MTATKNPKKSNTTKSNGDKPAKAKSSKVKPNATFSPKPDDAAAPDNTAMLRAALLVRDGSRERLAKLCDEAPDEGIPKNADILDHLGEEWFDEPDSGNEVPVAMRWRVTGGAMPKIWFGQSNAIGTVVDPHLQGFALADAAKPIILEITQERPLQPPLIVPHIEQPPNGRLSLDRIRVVANPREEFDPAEMQNLEDSIRARGIIQALTVSPADADGVHTLIAGERRLRCARKLELPDVPVYVRAFEAEDEAVDRLVENLQRVNLKPMELAKGFDNLLTGGGVTQRELARRLGVSQGHVGNTVRLLKLPPIIQNAVNSGEIGKAEGRTLATWTDHPAVINEFNDLWRDKLEGGAYADSSFLKILQVAVKDATRGLDKAWDGPRFKLTPEIRAELGIIHVKVGDWEVDRAFYSHVWDELQAKADKERVAKKAAAAAKKNAAAQLPATTNDPSAPSAPSKPTLSAFTLANLWKGWFVRALFQRFNVKKLKPADEDHLNRLAIILLEPLPHLLDKLKLNDVSEASAAGALMQQTLEGLLDALRVELMLELSEKNLQLFGSAVQAQVMCDAVGISLKTWTPDVEFLTVIPDAILLDFASEYDMRPSKSHEKLVDQLVEVWTVGWIPEPLNIFPAAE